MSPRPEFCLNCPIGHVTTGYVPLYNPEGATVLEVGEAAGENEAEKGLAFIGGAGAWRASLHRAAKINTEKVAVINCLGCRPPDNIFPDDVKFHIASKQAGREAIKYCYEHHLKPAVQTKQWDKIITYGDKALSALTDKKGVLVWRGSALPMKGKPEQLKVLPTLHPAYIARQAKMFPIVVKDLQRNLTIPPEYYDLYATEVEKHLGKEVSFDFEWDWRSGNITLCGLSSSLFGADVYGWNGDSIHKLREVFISAKGFIGHNIIGADISYLERLDWKIDWNEVAIWDTMLMQHLVMPDHKHDLGFVASVFTKKPFWKGHGEEEEDEDGNITDTKVQWQTWDSPTAVPRQLGGYGGCRDAQEAFRLYNARDTDAAFQIAIPLRQKLEQYGLMGVYENVSVPVAFVCRDTANYGIKLDHSRLADIRKVINKELDTLDKQLPDGLRSYEVEVTKNAPAPEGTYKSKVRTCKGTRKSPHEPRDFTFRAPEQCFECECGKVLVSGKMCAAKTVKVSGTKRIVPWNSTKQVLQYAASLGAKEVINRKTGRVSADKNTRKQWGRKHPEFTIVDSLKKNVTLRNSFAKEAFLLEERMFFNLLVHGTSEGRLSSSGKRKGIDLNIQNQPKKIRTIFVPDRGDWGILNPDWVQAENMITTWLAKDWDRWERLHAKGYNEHLDYAKRLFNCDITKTIKDETGGEIDNPLYIAAKRTNHLRNYGGGARKMQEVLAAEGFNYSESDMKEFIAVWKVMNARTAKWQEETIALVGRQSFLRNPFGRMRWFQCVVPGTPVLKSDLNWVSMGDLKVGDELIGFDEDISRGIPKYKPSILTYTKPFIDTIFAVETDKGTTYCTRGHGWATRLTTGGGGPRYLHRWITTEYLQPGDEIVWFNKPWHQETSTDAAWLSGMLDGESHIEKAWKRGYLGFSQNPGPVLERFMEVAKRLGYNPTDPRPTGTRNVLATRLKLDTERSGLEMIGRLRPTRFIANSRYLWDGAPMWGRTSYDEIAHVKSVKIVGRGEAIECSTTSKTLLTNGMCSHNSRDYATKSLAFLPASTLADICLRCMIALNLDLPRCAKAVGNLGIGVTYQLPRPWRLMCQVHDSLPAQGPQENYKEVAFGMKQVMAQPWPELEGFHLDVDFGWSTKSWGEIKGVEV